MLSHPLFCFHSTFFCMLFPQMSYYCPLTVFLYHSPIFSFLFIAIYFLSISSNTSVYISRSSPFNISSSCSTNTGKVFSPSRVFMIFSPARRNFHIHVELCSCRPHLPVEFFNSSYSEDGEVFFLRTSAVFLLFDL